MYDRSDLIHRAIETLKRTLIEESLIVALVCVVFLMHCALSLGGDPDAPGGGAGSPSVSMRLLGMNSNLMSLGGIAIAIGAMVDAAIVMIENAHKHLERLPEEHTNSDRVEAMIAGLQGGGPGFVLLAAHHHRVLPAGVHAGVRRKAACSRPLAYTKTFAMAGAALLSVTLVPVLMMLFIRGKIMPESATR